LQGRKIKPSRHKRIEEKRQLEEKRREAEKRKKEERKRKEEERRREEEERQKRRKVIEEFTLEEPPATQTVPLTSVIQSPASLHRTCYTKRRCKQVGASLRDSAMIFLTSGFFIIQFPQAPEYMYYYGRFEFFRKFS
jgi:hypothetical protein